MDAEHFDAMTRLFARAVSRRGLMGAAAALTAAAAAPAGLRSAAAQSDAGSLVQQYYETIDAYQYQDAYALLGSKWRSQQSLSNLTKGYADTAFVQCQITGQESAANGVTVHVKLLAWHNDGAIVAYQGRYLVGTEGGQQRILAGDNTLIATPKNTPPLCTLADLSFSFGHWNGATGSVVGVLSGTNTSQATCALGGSPRLRLTDASGRRIDSTSIPGSPPEAVIVAPGKSANAQIRFSNSCAADLTDPLAVQIDVPGDPDHAVIHPPASAIAYPRCDQPSSPDRFAVLGWTAAPS